MVRSWVSERERRPVSAVVPLAKACNIKNGVICEIAWSIPNSGGSTTVPSVPVTNKRKRPVPTVMNIITIKK